MTPCHARLHPVPALAPANVKTAAALLERLDIEHTKWVAELLVGDGRNERVLRQLQLDGDANARASYGAEDALVMLTLHGEAQGVVAAGERIALLDTVPSERREAIVAILGIDGPVGSIGLRFRPRE